MQFFQILTGVAAVVGCSANLVHLNGQKLFNNDKIIDLQRFDTGNKWIGHQQLDAGNKLIGLSAFDSGNKIMGVHDFAQPSKVIVASQPAHLHMSTGRSLGLANSGLSTFALGGVSPIAIDNSQLLNTHLNRDVRLIDASPSIASFGGRSLDLAHVSAPQLIMSGRSADQVIATQAVSSDVKPVTAAVATLSRTVDYAPVAYAGEPAKTQVVNVPPNEQGLHINFVSKSSPLTVSQQHIGGDAGQVHVTESVDEPQRLIHNVKKSVIQEVNEVVQPFRVLKQEVKPVIEQAHTLVAEGNKIPLSGRSSGVIATESAAPTLLHRPTQVITAHEPRSLNVATIAQPAAALKVVEHPQAINMAVAQPRAMHMAIAQPRAMNMVMTQPRAMNMVMTQPRAMNMVMTQPAAFSTGSLMFDANPAMIGEKRHMIIHQQPSMLIKQKNFAMPIGASAMDTQFFSKPSAFLTGNDKLQLFQTFKS